MEDYFVGGSFRVREYFRYFEGKGARLLVRFRSWGSFIKFIADFFRFVGFLLGRIFGSSRCRVYIEGGVFIIV